MKNQAGITKIAGQVQSDKENMTKDKTYVQDELYTMFEDSSRSPRNNPVRLSSG